MVRYLHGNEDRDYEWWDGLKKIVRETGIMGIGKWKRGYYGGWPCM